MKLVLFFKTQPSITHPRDKSLRHNLVTISIADRLDVRLNTYGQNFGMFEIPLSFSRRNECLAKCEFL